MSYKIHKWVTALFQYAVIVCTFVSGCYVAEYGIASAGYHPLDKDPVTTYTLVNSDNHSLFDSLFKEDNFKADHLIMVVGFALLAAMLCGAVFCLLHITAGDKRYTKTVTAASVFQILLLGGWGLLIGHNSWTNNMVQYTYTPGVLFYVLLGVCAAWVAVNVWGLLSKKNA